MAKAPGPVKGSNSAKKAPAKKAAPAPKSVAAAKQAAPAKAAPTKTAAKKTAATRPPATKTSATKTAVKKTAVKKTAASKTAGSTNGTSPTKKPARSPFSAAFLRQQHAALLVERATYVRQAESLQAEAEALVADFESGDVQFDEESGEGDTLNIERERDLTLSAQARAAVEEIDHALAKFDLGTYGICETSGDPIPEERLDAIPWARQRVEYKTGGLGRR